MVVTSDNLAEPDLARKELAHKAGAPERSRANTRRRLVAAGTELFAAQGLLKTTTVQIARGAGVAAGTFYLHFPDKHALFREIAFDALARLRTRLGRTAAHPGLGGLRARMRELLAFADEERDLMRIVFGRGHEAPGLADELLDELFPGVEARLRERLAAGEIDPGLHPAATAQALLATWTRVVAWWVEDPQRAAREEVAETLVRLHPLHQFTR